MVSLVMLVTSMGGGGAERIASTLQDKLPQTLNREFVMFHKRESAYTIPGKIFTIMNYSPSKNMISKVGLNIIGFARYVNHLRAVKPKVVISFQAWDNIWNLLSSLFTSVVPVISIHGEPKAFSGYTKYLLRIGGYLARIVHDARIIAVSNGVKEQYCQLYHVSNNKIKVLYNPIDVKLINSLALSADIPSYLFSAEYPVIITVGRLHPIKGQHHLIRTFATLRRERLAKLLICGIGTEETYLKKLAKDLGVEDDVVFIGWQENPYKYMARSTVFVLSSFSEALPNVLIEAMASGCPVISANCSSGIREIIGENNEYGLLAEPMTGVRHCFDEPLDSGEVSLLVLIQMMLDDTKLQKTYIEKGKERAEFFSVEKRMKEYEVFIQGFLKK